MGSTSVTFTSHLRLITGGRPIASVRLLGAHVMASLPEPSNTWCRLDASGHRGCRRKRRHQRYNEAGSHLAYQVPGKSLLLKY